MVTVKRANVILTIEDDEVDKYLEKGYSVIDESGNVLKASVPTDVGTLQKALYEKEVEIATLKQEIERLKSTNKTSNMVSQGSGDSTPEVRQEKRPYNKKKIQEQ